MSIRMRCWQDSPKGLRPSPEAGPAMCLRVISVVNPLKAAEPPKGGFCFIDH